MLSRCPPGHHQHEGGRLETVSHFVAHCKKLARKPRGVTKYLKANTKPLRQRNYACCMGSVQELRLQRFDHMKRDTRTIEISTTSITLGTSRLQNPDQSARAWAHAPGQPSVHVLGLGARWELPALVAAGLCRPPLDPGRSWPLYPPSPQRNLARWRPPLAALHS